jgi:hypothetical protein
MPTTLRTLYVVKLEELPPDALVSGSQDSSSDPSVQSAVPREQRLHVTDRTSNIRYLIDSGSVVSVVPRTLVKQKTTQTRPSFTPMVNI